MSLESILSRIESETLARREEIIQEAKENAARIIKESVIQARSLYEQILKTEGLRYENQKQRLLVNARLEAKKNQLKVKQELISNVFNNLKHHCQKSKLIKYQISQDTVRETQLDVDTYLEQMKFDYESKIAEIIFG